MENILKILAMKSILLSRLAIAALLFLFVQVSVAQDAGAAREKKETANSGKLHSEQHGKYLVELEKNDDVVRVNVMENGKKVANKGEMTGKVVLVYDDMTSDIMDMKMDSYGTMSFKITNKSKNITHIGAQVWMGEEVVAVRHQF